MRVTESVSEQYRDYYGSERLAEWRRLGAIDKVDNIVEMCSSVRTVLDIGCGDGAIIQRLSEVGFAQNYQGLDISESAIRQARTRSLANANFEVFDGSKVGFPDQHFDLAVLSHVIEHLEHPRFLVREAQRVAKRVFVEVPCEHTMRLPRDYRPDPVGHINYYTPTTIRRFIQTCGLEVEQQITRDCSPAVIRFERPVMGAIQFAIRRAALTVAPRLATSMFVYHTALLCH